MKNRLASGPRVRRLLLLGYAGIFAVWVLSAYALTERMAAADDHAAVVRSRFLHNDELLSTTRANVLLGSIYVRDALLETNVERRDGYRQQVLEIQQQVDDAVQRYVPLTEEATEMHQWQSLRKELGNYWTLTRPVIANSDPQSAVATREMLVRDVIPKRDAIIRISDQVHALNQLAFQEAQREISDLRRDLRRRVWETSGVAVGLGLIVAWIATRHAGRLETRLSAQRQEETGHKLELERLSSQLMQAQEAERRRIARELHDEIGQALSAVKLELAVAAQPPSDAARQALGEARTITDRALQQVRDMSQLLHPAMLDDLGLPDTANWYLNGFSRRTAIRSELVVDGLERRLPPAVEVCTYRVIQEAVTNIARHAGATRCRVEIRGAPRALTITVEDDGRGFDLFAPASPTSRGLGLVSVRERVAALSGTLHVDSQPGRGTRLVVELPLEEHAWAS